MNTFSPHTFHIPVMGLAFTIDSPIKVAHFGITSAISIVEDNLIEVMRKYYYQKYNFPYIPITKKEPDYRAKRITDYLNLVNRIVQDNVEKLKNSAFEAGSDIVKYFEMLPEHNELKKKYYQMISSRDHIEKIVLEEELRNEIKAGSIEVNVMTKVDRENYDKKGNSIENGSDAVSALRGYTKSELKNSSIVFSAGLNPRLYNYLENFSEFDAKGLGDFDKKVVIKVSDYRSALIQGKYLAKKGIWVSEFRIESGLNCGGHAFATEGYLMGPILEEFKNKKDELSYSLFDIYRSALIGKGKKFFDFPHPIKITVQGGIGTAEEDSFLKRYYEVNSTGWGTPFLLCPEATTVDDPTLDLLCKSKEQDVVLSKNSPLGIRFNYLKGTTSDKEKEERIKKNNPGSPCTEEYLSFNTEFTEKPICTASKKYQKLKITQLESLGLPNEELTKQKEEVLSKECLCIGLSNSAPMNYKTTFKKSLKAVTICPGPNIAYFSQKVTLKEMVDHIYGRATVIKEVSRPHMFLKELQLYVNYLFEQFEETKLEDTKTLKYYRSFCTNLLDGIDYYRKLISGNLNWFPTLQNYNESLDQFRREIEKVLDKLLRKEASNQLA